jgi:hypothetical protein
MSYNETISFAVGYKLLEEELANSTTTPTIKPTTLALKNIHMAHSVLQPREFAETASSEEHVRTLLKAIGTSSGNVLDPIVVWWSGKCWRVIDGHHRVLAYARFRKEKKGKLPPIPVRIFEGSLNEAILESTRLNSKDKLAMSKEDKVNRAWRFVVLDSNLSKRDIASVCSVGTTLIGTMRKRLSVMREGNPEGYLEEAIGLSWADARRDDEDGRGFDELAQERQAKEWARRLGKAFGKKLLGQPEIFARALELYSQGLSDGLWYYLKTPDDYDEFNLEPQGDF